MKRIVVLLTGIAVIAALLFPRDAQAGASSPVDRTGADTASSMAAMKLHTATDGFSLLGGVLPAETAALPQAEQSFDEPAPLLVTTRAISIPYGIEPTAQLSNNRRHILIEGHGACTAGQRVSIRVMVTQATTGARAVGRTQQLCTGDLQQWSVKAVAHGPARFVPGSAQACGVARTRFRGRITDTFQWCRDITLISKADRTQAGSAAPGDLATHSPMFGGIVRHFARQASHHLS